MKRRSIAALRFLSVLILCGIVVLCGCSQTDECAQILSDDAVGSLNKDFCDKNRVSGVYYDNAGLDDPSCPAARTLLIKTAEEYKEAFSSTADPAVDFQSRMIVVYTFADINKRAIEIKKISTSEASVRMELAHKKASSGIGDSCAPYQRYVVIRLDRNDINDISISLDQPLTASLRART